MIVYDVDDLVSAMTFGLSDYDDASGCFYDVLDDSGPGPARRVRIRVVDEDGDILASFKVAFEEEE